MECIAKGKAGKKYEFGNKVSVAVTSRGGWLVGAQSYTGNPYDGHTLAAQLQQVSNLIGDQVSEAYVDMGYRGHDYEGEVTVRVDKRSKRPNAASAVAMDEAARGGRTQHRSSEGRTPVGAQPAEGRCRRRVQCHVERRGNELPEAAGSFLAQFSALPAARMGLDSATSAFTVCKCLKALKVLFQDRLY